MKLNLPTLPLSFIRREPLMARIEQFEACSIHGFFSASGYGKTLALGQWLHAKRLQKEIVAWLTLDEKENDPQRFVLYLVSALDHVDHQFSHNALRLIEEHSDPESILDALISGVISTDKNINFAIDDLHVLNNEVCIDLLERFISYTHGQVTYYLCSQKSIGLDLSRYIGQRNYAQYDEYDLAFNRDELQKIIEQDEFSCLAHCNLVDLLEISQGWFVGLNLIKQIVEETGRLNVRGTEKILVDFIHHQWRENISDHEYRMCLHLATLGKANGFYIDHVFQEDNGQQNLLDLSQQHVHVLRDKEQNDWFYLHPLLQCYLSQYVDDASLEIELGRASQWLSRHNYAVPSVQIAFRTKNLLQVASLLENTAETIFEQHNLTQLLKWKKDLPDDVITTSPKLVIIFSWTLAYAQQFDEAERLLAKMDGIDVAKKTEDADGISGQLFAIRGYIARCRGKMSNAIQLCNQALDKLDARHYVAKSITYFNLSNVYMSQDKLALSRQFNRLSFETARSAGSIHLEMQAIHEHARIEQVRGNLHLAEKLLNEGLTLKERLAKNETAAPYGRLLIYKGYIAWLKNRTDEAEALLRLGIEVAYNCRDAYIIMGYVLLSNIARHNSDVEHAYDLLSQVETTLQYWSVPNFIYQPWLSTMRVNLQIDENKIDTAIVNLKQLYGSLAQNEYALSPEHYPGLKRLCDVFYVRAKSISGQHGKALKLLDKKLENDGDSQQGFSLIFSLLMRALLRYQLGQEDNALQDFRKALVLAEKNYCIMPFIEYSQSMLALYDQLPSSIQEKPFVKAILDNIRQQDQPEMNRAFAKIPTVISQRELTVLKLIAEGLSNQEIAQRLFISLHTVKTHARRINSKLSVKNRTQAIIKARETGVI